MALSGLRLQKPPGLSHFHKTGLIKSARCCSSSSSGESQKKLFKAEKLEAKTYVHGPWHCLKHMFTSLKEMLLGNPQSLKQIMGERTDAKGCLTASEDISTQNSPYATESGEPLRIVTSCEVEREAQSTKKCNLKSMTTSHMLKEDFSKDEVRQDVSGRFVGLDRNHGTGAEHISCLIQQLGNETFRTIEKSSVKLLSIGNGNFQLEKTATFVQTEIVGSKVDKMPASSEGSQNVMGLVGLHMSTKSDCAVGGRMDKRSMIASKLPDKVGGRSGEDAAGDIEIKGLIDSIKGLSRDQPIIMGQKSDVKRRNTSLKSNTMENESNKGNIADNKKREERGSLNEGRNLNMADNDKMKSQPYSDVKKSHTSLKGHSMGSRGKKLNVKKGEPSSGNKNSYINFVADDTSLKGHSMGNGGNKLNVKKEKPSSGNKNSYINFVADDQVKPEPSLPPTSKEGLDETLSTSFPEERYLQNKVLVRFLNEKVEIKDIFLAFQHCGSIVNIEVVSPAVGSYFKDAFIYFQTKEGLQKALKTPDPTVKKTDVVVEATYSKDIPNTISIPDQIGDPDVPVAMLKNPTRTVKITQLAHGTTSHHLKEALAFLGGGITSCFLDSSSSVAYVEFETEDSKECAIARHSINVLGKQLLIFRIDAPRTTVIRISNVPPKLYSKVRHICNSYGMVKYIIPRATGIMDVHFKLAELPKVLKILNSLNGLQLEDGQLLAQPAPVFPPEILKALWSKPDERRHVKAVILKLAKNTDLEDTTELLDLVSKYYSNDCE
ncbi:RRM_6 domain-containing protein [Cephalotus follicularis]|uniref:RRM_6 domain-containing protein n=1 Tax=Cephalotus follicularis TaxID=3775 RepID=A0A1Q3CGQ8_CEPFO|nr:RRM_6 domain-containing protein [Cephalotus follicularis]